MPRAIASPPAAFGGDAARCAGVLPAHLVLLVLAGCLAAAEIELRNGQKLSGEIVEEGADFVVLKAFLKPNQRIARADIAAIRGHQPAGGAAAPAAKAVPAGPYGFRRDGSGHFPDATPPAQWAVPKNQVWKCDLPGAGNSSPVLCGDRLFVTCEPSTLVCVDRASGKLLWQKTNTYENVLGDKGKTMTPPQPEWMEAYGYCTPTPVTDGKLVCASFGTGVVVAYDLAGNRLWANSYDAKNRVAGTAFSPVIHEGRVVLFTAAKDGYALDVQTGKVLWQVDGSGGYGSGVVVAGSAGAQLVTPGRVYDLATGKVVRDDLLGKAYGGDPKNTGSNWGPSVIVEGGIAYVHTTYKPEMRTSDFRAIRLDAPAGAPPLWVCDTTEIGKEFYKGRCHASPVIANGVLYAISGDGILWAIDSTDGKVLHTTALKRGMSMASLCVANGLVHIFGKSWVTVIKPGREYKPVANFDPGIKVKTATPIFAGKVIYQRDETALYCIGP